ncbi:MAG: hypothetical protein ACYCYP_07950 [Leptospirales bacterium]
MNNFTAVSPEEAMAEAGELPQVKTPPILSDVAFYGLAGEFCRALAPSTEADPAAILLQTLIAFGAACGRGPHLMIDGSRHGVNEFGVIVGQSSKARKGTGWRRTHETLSYADEEFFEDGVKGGLSSGEGLIYQIRDEVQAFDPKKGAHYTADPGISDKRLLLVEEEFSAILKQVEREGNVLSQIVRQAWDSRTLSPLTKANRIKATNPHISIIGQITEVELRKRLSEVEIANGFGNRILWFFVRRSKLLPFGACFDQSRFFGDRFRCALEFAKTVQGMAMSPSFMKDWEAVYPVLTEAAPGLAGSLTSRQEAHAMRLSMIFALMDQEKVIDSRHLRPTLAIVDFVSDSVSYIFGEVSGDPIQDKIVKALDVGTGRISLTEIHGLFDRHVPKNKLETALDALVRSGKIEVQSLPGEAGGRPKTIILRKRG